MPQPFTRDELVVLLDHHLRRSAGEPIDGQALSRRLRALPANADRPSAEAFRTPDGVMRAVRRFDAYARGGDDRDSPHYRAVWDRYAHDPEALSAAVAQAEGKAPLDPVPHGTGIKPWWRDLPSERFWLEASHRTDRGIDLHAPIANKDGDPYWSYELVREVRAGDVVFHYDAGKMAIVAWSVATGDHWRQDAWWAARGTSSRDRAPVLQPHWFCGLNGPFELDAPLRRAALVAEGATIAAVRAQLPVAPGDKPYFPFQLRRDGLRIGQGYLFKLPAALVAHFPPLAAAVGESELRDSPAADPAREPAGRGYRRADTTATVAERDPFPVDPAVVERSLRSHALLQNELADMVSAAGYEPRSPDGTAFFDLAWHEEDVLWVAEVKSLTAANEERQLRLGLGQLLRYRHMLAGQAREVRAMLYVERRPRDNAWIEVCEAVDVVLRWPALDR
ncbi:MAG TPA: hypothetical protein VFU94_04125 [Conexibacter sp.]|nr:hypothetical protein [Conexibacter sp.]